MDQSEKEGRRKRGGGREGKRERKNEKERGNEIEMLQEGSSI